MHYRAAILTKEQSVIVYYRIHPIGHVQMSKVGDINAKVIAALGLTIAENTPVFMGQTNVQRMINEHPNDYARYGADIPSIIATPDYVRQNPTDNSIEYVKQYIQNGEHVKVAVRVSNTGVFYARSIYVLNESRVRNFIAKGTLKPIR